MKKILLSCLFIAYAIFSFAQTNTKSILFDGTNDSISVPNKAVLNPTTALSIEAWIKASSYGTNVWDNYIVGKDDWSNASAGYSLRCGASGKLSFNFSSGGGAWKEVVSTTMMPTNVWTHVAATFDGTSLKIYINGVLSGSLSYSGAINPSTYNLNIGSVPYTAQGGRLFAGKIDQVEIWNKALSAAQVFQYMNCPPLGTETGLVAFWDFEAGSGNTVTDLTANHNNGTMYNSPSWSTDAMPTSCGSSGINTNASENEINIFPNPANNSITINFTSVNDISSDYVITDQIGRRILSGKISEFSNTIDIHNLHKGVYILKIAQVKTMKVFKN
ncbi:MAG: LamG-like jellyroll fold domain-containing protein [Bacteroidales bacterium]